MQASFTGKLLVASSSATHPLYAGGVCLIVHQDTDQTIGVMLNRPMQPIPEAVEMLMAGEDLGDEASAEEEFEDGEWSEPEQDSWNHDSDFTDGYLGDDGSTHHDFSNSEFSQNADSENAEAADSSEIARPTNRLGSAGEMGLPGEMTTGKFGIPLQNLHFGGPMSGPVVALHRSAQHAEMEPGLGIYVAAQRDHLEQLIREHDESFRLIVGHLRWTDDELQRELDAGIWHPLPATVDNAFLPAFGMWPRLIRRATSRSLANWIGTPDVEQAGELN